MGLFGGGKGGGSFFDRIDPMQIAAIQATLAGDYGAMAQISGDMRQRRSRETTARQEEARRQSLYNNLIKQGMDPGQAELALTNPEAFGQEFNTRFRTREQGAGGGSVSTPRLGGGFDVNMAPSRHVIDDRVVDVSGEGAPTQRYDAQQDAIRWINPGEGVAPFATDRSGRPIAPGTNIQSPMGGGGVPQSGPAAPAQASPTAANGQSGYAAGMASVFANAGLPQPVIAGILGNGHHESGGQWNAAVGDGGTAHGAFQWRDERVANFQRIIGVHPGQANPAQTAQFVLWEFQNPEQAGMTREQVQAIVGARTPQEAATLFSRYYERPNANFAHEDRRSALAAQYAGGDQFAQAGQSPVPGQGRSVQDMAGTNSIQIPPRAPPGYQYQADGTLHAITGGPGDQNYQRGREATTDARAGRQEVGTVIQQFRNDPDVRAWRQSRTAVLQLRSLGQSGSATDDLAMVFMFMKTVDPQSTVREGEFAQAQNSAGVPDRIRSYYNQLREGTRLTPTQRTELTRTAERLYTDRSRTYNELAENYREQLRGMGATNIGRMIPISDTPMRVDRARDERQRRQQQQNRPTIRVIRRRPIR